MIRPELCRFSGAAVPPTATRHATASAAASDRADRAAASGSGPQSPVAFHFVYAYPSAR